ncbi:MAG: hypothetical protein KF699_12285, partial [Phycisphaeraceae bacterium]|nr:hypothetical protein [Phycisphaeraceae bacterium]
MKSNSNQSRRRWWSGTRRRMLSRAGRALGLSHDDGRGIEALEQRVHLAVIVWDGGPDGTGTNFHDPVNWAGDVLPGSEDDAVIPDMPGSPVILLAQSASLRSLASEESISHTFGTLTVHFPSTLNANYTLDGGVITGGGSIAIGAVFDWRNGPLQGPGNLMIESSGELRMNDLSFGDLGRSVVNHGTVSQDDALLTLLSGASLTNHGLWTVSGGGAINNSGAVPMFTNTGTLRRVTGGPVETNFGATTNGQVVNSGAIEVLDGMLLIGGAGGSNSGTVTIAADAMLNLVAGWTHNTGSSIAGSGTLFIQSFNPQSIAGASEWSVASIVLDAGTIAGPGTLTVLGSVSWQSGSLSGGALTGTGDITIVGNVTFGSGSISGSGSLGGPGTMRFEGPGSTSLNREVEIDHLVMMGGTVAGSGAITVANELTWNQGTLGGSATVTVLPDAVLTFSEGTLARTLILEGTMTATGAGDLSFAGGTLIIAEGGTLNWFGAGSLVNISGVNEIVNLDRIEIATSGATVLVGVPLANHAGAFLIVSTPDAATVTLSGGGSNAGVIDVGSDVSLRFESAFAHQTGSMLGGAGHFVIAGSQTINGLTTWWATTGSLDGGAITGTGNLSFTGEMFTWSGGSLSGTGSFTIQPGASMLLTAPAASLSRPLVNLGTVTQNGGILTIAPGTTASTSGTWHFNSGQITGDGEFAIMGGTFNHAGGQFAGSGRLTVGPGVTLWTGGTYTRGLHNHGSVIVNGGRLTLTNTDNLNAGTILLWDSEIDLSNGPMTHLGGSQIVVEFDSSSINITLGSAVQTIAAGLVTWTAGSEGFYFNDGGNITGPGDLRLVGTTYIDGSITINGSGRLEIDGQLLILESMTLSRPLFLETSTNLDARLEVQPGVTLTLAAAPANLVDGTLQGGWWNVAGTLLLPMGVQINSLNAWASLYEGGSFPALMSISSTGPGASLTPYGAHTFTPASGTFTNSGRISLTLGSVMTINGAFTNAAGGTIHSSISGTDPETEYGRLAVTGAVTLGGSFEAQSLFGFMPGAGETFTFITGASRSGRFASHSLPAASGGLTTLPVYTATSFGMAAAMVHAWDGGPTGLGTNWHDPVNWVGDVLPGAGSIVYISVAANPTITITANVTIAGLISDEVITQSGGTFTINGAADFNALFTLSGGELTG